MRIRDEYFENNYYGWNADMDVQWPIRLIDGGRLLRLAFLCYLGGVDFAENVQGNDEATCQY
ncbi:MAG: hypothetical protein OXL40_00810 [Bacteroidota bacterium]|nr:hypothetical protein [Bacteroidota bacterium]